MLDKWLIDIVTDIYKRTGEPAGTLAVSARLGKGDRDCRRYLAAMEEQNKIARVSARGGWVPMYVVENLRNELKSRTLEVEDLTEQLATMQVQLALCLKHERAGRPVLSTLQAARETGLSPSQVNRYISRGWWNAEKDMAGRWWIYADQELRRRPPSLPPLRTPNGYIKRIG